MMATFLFLAQPYGAARCLLASTPCAVAPSFPLLVTHEPTRPAPPAICPLSSCYDTMGFWQKYPTGRPEKRPL